MAKVTIARFGIASILIIIGTVFAAVGNQLPYGTVPASSVTQTTAATPAPATYAPGGDSSSGGSAYSTPTPSTTTAAPTAAPAPTGNKSGSGGGTAGGSMNGVTFNLVFYAFDVCYESVTVADGSSSQWACQNYEAFYTLWNSQHVSNSGSTFGYGYWCYCSSLASALATTRAMGILSVLFGCFSTMSFSMRTCEMADDCWNGCFQKYRHYINVVLAATWSVIGFSTQLNLYNSPYGGSGSSQDGNGNGCGMGLSTCRPVALSDMSGATMGASAWMFLLASIFFVSGLLAAIFAPDTLCDAPVPHVPSSTSTLLSTGGGYTTV